MLGDERESIMRQAVPWIKRAREQFDFSNHPQQFLSPKNEFGATDYTEMTDWEEGPCTEPPLTMHIKIKEIMEAVKQGCIKM